MNIISQNTVLKLLANTTCTICGNKFIKPRVGKIYCSSRCKQYGYNYKDKILGNQPGAPSQAELPRQFCLNEYACYKRLQSNLRRFSEISKKYSQWEQLDQAARLKMQYGVSISELHLASLASKKLTDSEEIEFSKLESELDEEMFECRLPELSLEQWSFLKKMYPTLDQGSFLNLISSLSNEYLQNLSLLAESDSKKLQPLIVKSQFLNHCNDIATGEINFFTREIEEMVN